MSKAPSFSKEMLRDKVFGAYEDDEEFKLVYFSMMPLYQEVFDPNAALVACRNMVFVAESHSKLSLINEILDFEEINGYKMISIRHKKSTSIILKSYRV